MKKILVKIYALSKIWQNIPLFIYVYAVKQSDICWFLAVFLNIYSEFYNGISLLKRR